MASHQPACLYQETRLNLDPADSGSVIDVQVASQSSFSARLSPKRRRIDRPPIAYTEDTFSKYNLASESAIHFRPTPKDRKKSHSPRAVLWRVLNERRLLELQAVDIYQDASEKQEPYLTLRFNFQEPIRSGGIAFAEKDVEAGSNALVAFVLIGSGELFTLTLRREHFSKKELLQDEVAARSKSWCTSCTPSSLGYRMPFRLYARDDKDLWVSCGDGSLVRLTRSGDDGFNWRDSAYTEGGWTGSMRGLLPWKHQKTVRYNNADIQINTAVSIAVSPDDKHVWTVSLDHMLRAWSIETGGVVFQQELARKHDGDHRSSPEVVMQPGLPQKIQILPGKHGADYYIMTFSAITTAFRIWLIKDAEVANDGWSDVQPDTELRIPIEGLGESSAWSLDTFNFGPPKRRAERWDLWILVRLGTQYQAYTTTFDLDEDQPEVFGKSWRENWVRIDHGSVSSKALKSNLQNPSEVQITTTHSDARRSSELWTEFLFYPGRFTAETLETALNVYSRSLGCPARITLAKGHPAHEKPLKNRILETVGKSIALGPASDDGLHYARFEQAIAGQWQVFYGVVKDLHLRREEIMSLAIDPEEHTPWVVAADSVSLIRACSEIEILWHNKDFFSMPHSLRAGSPLLESLTHPENSSLGQLFHALEVFRNSLSPSFTYGFISILTRETLHDVDQDVVLTLQTLYDDSSFAGEVSDADYDQLTDALEALGGFGSLDNDLLVGALDFLTEVQKGTVRKHQQLARYGARTLIRGAQETLQLGFNVVLDLLLLVTFIGCELEEGDLSENFDSAKVFDQLIAKAREFQLLSWLASKTPYDGPKSSKGEADPFTTAGGMASPLSLSHTILENMFVGDWSTMKIPAGPQTHVITYWCRAWTFGLTISGHSDEIASAVFGSLIQQSQTDLALEFLPFVSEEPWSLYLTGRLFLMVDNLDQANTNFKAAAEGLSTGKFIVPEQLPAIGLLDFEDRECLNNGFVKYYQHIISLFEKAKAYSYVTDFAQMALGLESDENLNDPKLQTDLLSRLFTSAHRTSRFELAYSALSRHSDLTLRDSSLRTLVTTLVTSPDLPTLLSLPYTPDLSAVADATISDLAAKQETLPSTIATTQSHYRVLYAFRLRRHDLRGAASCLWERLQVLRQSQDVGFRGEDVDEEVAECYLTLINVLSLVRADQAWILTRPQAIQGEMQKRMVVTLPNVRRAWQEELDRVADVAAGRFAIGLDWSANPNGPQNAMPGSFGETNFMEADRSAKISV